MSFSCLRTTGRLAVMLCLSLVAGAASASDRFCRRLVWSDEFDGTRLDPKKWEIQVGDGCAQGICGWGNSELQVYRRENVSVADGLLKIEARRERTKEVAYSSARLRTRGFGEWTGGRVEASLRLPAGRGMWPAFWMLPTDELAGSWPHSGEIDIVELIGSNPSVVHGSVHFSDSNSDHASRTAAYSLPEGQSFAEEFHRFAVERREQSIRWFVDDVEYARVTAAALIPANWPFDERFHLLLNLAVGGRWPGNPDASTEFPQVLEVDYVRVFEFAECSARGD